MKAPETSSLTIKEEKESFIQVETRARATIGSGTEKLDTVCVPALDLYQGRQGWGRWKNHHFTTTFAFHHSRSTSNKPLTINRKFKTSWSIGRPPPHIWVWTFSWIQTMMVKLVARLPRSTSTWAMEVQDTLTSNRVGQSPIWKTSSLWRKPKPTNQDTPKVDTHR